MFSKKVILILLAIVSVPLGVQAVRNDPSFAATLWSQLFWLTVGTLATTFVLNAILERGIATRRRKEDRFAFRTFTASVFSSLLTTVNAAASYSTELMTSALADKPGFAKECGDARDFIAGVASFQQDAYSAHYLDVANHLRELANRFIRLFSNTQQEMLDHYHALQELARRWRYRDVLGQAFTAYTNSLAATDPVRLGREGETMAAEAEVIVLLRETASYLTVLAERAAAGPGMPPVS